MLAENFAFGLVGGSVGTILIAALFAILLPMMRRVGDIALIVLIGALAGGLGLSLMFSITGSLYQMITLQMIWHTSVLAALSGVIARAALR